MELKILIVDDEVHIRSGIARMLELGTLEAKISGLAGNVGEALEIVKKEKPHIVITDIRMPDEDGLSLTEKILESIPSTRIIIISGYDEFEYARKAMRLGVKEYILKPLNKEALNNTLIRIKREIEKEVSERENTLQIKNKLFSSYKYARTKFFEGIIEGKKIDDKELREKEKLFNMELVHGEFVALLICIENGGIETDKTLEDEEDSLRYSITNITEEVIQCSSNKILVYPNKNEILVLCPVEEIQSGKELRRYALEIRNSISQSIGINLCISFSGSGSRLYELRQVYSKLRITMLNKFICAERIFEASRLNEVANKDVYLGWEKRLHMYVEFNDFTKSSEVIDDIFSRETGGNFCAESLFFVLQRIYHVLFRILNNGGIGGIDRREDAIGRVITNTTLAEVIHTIKEEFFAVIAEKNPVHENENRMVIMLAQQYINQHYQENISQNQVADYLNISPQYLSTLFKKYTGDNFIDYLTSLRIENSKRLLEQQNLKVYEIAFRVGYNDPKHYLKVFKRLTGVTPNEYREKFAAGNNCTAIL